MVTTGYYLVALFIFGSLFLQFYKYLKTRKNPTLDIESNAIVKTISESFRNSFYDFITFLCLYFYFIRNHDGNFTLIYRRSDGKTSNLDPFLVLVLKSPLFCRVSAHHCVRRRSETLWSDLDCLHLCCHFGKEFWLQFIFISLI